MLTYVAFILIVGNIVAVVSESFPYFTMIDVKNLTRSNWPDVYNEYCGRKCVEGRLVIANRTYCNTNKCFPCECDNDCNLKGTCCPSTEQIMNVKTLENGPTAMKDSIAYAFDAFRRAECLYLNLDNNSGGDRYVVNTCRDSWRDPIVRGKCELSTQLYRTLDERTLYTDINTRLVFQNIYCALCNGYDTGTYTPVGIRREVNGLDGSGLRAWMIRIHCSDEENSLHEFHDKHTAVEYLFNEIWVQSCSANQYSTGIEILCLPSDPVTRHTKLCPDYHDKTVSYLCQNLPSDDTLVVGFDRNIFCAMCNGRLDVLLPCDDDFEEYHIYAPSKNDKLETRFCWPNAWPGDEIGCMPISCSPGKLFFKHDDGEKSFDGNNHEDADDDVNNDGGSCDTSLKEVNKLHYSIHAVFVPENPLPVHLFENIGPFLDNIPNIPVRQYGYFLYPKEYNFKTMTCSLGGGREKVKQEIWFKFEWIQTGGDLRDDFEKEFLKAITQSHLTVTVNGTQTIQLRVLCIGLEFCELYHTISQSNNCSLVNNRTIEVGEEGMFRRDQLAIDITPSLVCPYVNPVLVSASFLQDTEIVFTIQLKDQMVSITDVFNISIQDGQFRLCLSLFKELVRGLEFESINLINEIDTFILVISRYMYPIASATSCLVLLAHSAMCYMFKCLRTLPRLNTLCFCGVLAVSNLSLLVVLLLRSAGILSKTHCLISAVILHYSWIASFIWINVCCVHTYRLYYITTSHVVESPKKLLALYSALSFGSPVLVVAIVITMATVITRGASIGYDGDVCFLDESNSNLITILGLITPLGLSCLVNGVVFTLVMKNRLRPFTKSQNDHKRHDDVSVDTTVLSVVASTACFVATAVVRFNSPVILFIFGLFLAVQSVITFLGLVSDRQFLKLCVKTFLVSRKTPSIDIQVDTA